MIQATDPAVPTDLMQVGEIRAAYGIQGWVWIFSETDPIANIFNYQPWWVNINGRWKSLNLIKSKTQGKGLVASIEGVNTRNLAESLLGTMIHVSQAMIPKAGSDEYYWKDLMGLKVFGQASETSEDPNARVLLGEISDMFSTGANDVIVVGSTADSIDDTERLIPWHKTTLGEIDMEKREMNVFWREDY